MEKIIYLTTLYNSCDETKNTIPLDGSAYTEEQVKNFFGHYVYALAKESEVPAEYANVETDTEDKWWLDIMHCIVQFPNYHYEL